MGGLYSRYALGLLYNPETGLVAGLQPVSFVCIASPHLGVCGLVPKVVETALKGLALYGGRTAQHMFLTGIFFVCVCLCIPSAALLSLLHMDVRRADCFSHFSSI